MTLPNVKHYGCCGVVYGVGKYFCSKLYVQPHYLTNFLLRKQLLVLRHIVVKQAHGSYTEREIKKNIMKELTVFETS